ncbi:MAG: PEP-CTERM protein-sorting domain-containing protein [Candidatus Nitrotoga sp. SPKER]|nr:MAG: PEP-CTERM protein-sorting domain-containing protein [Candidatus Nitrotoga sp. SPKER]
MLRGNIKLMRIIAVVILWGMLIAASVHATPIVYEGMLAPNATVSRFNSISGGGFLDLGRSSEIDFWSFYGEAGRTITIRADRLNPDVDLIFNLYLGTTSVDSTSAFVYNANSWGGMTRLATRDDEIDSSDPSSPNYRSPSGDPLLAPAVASSSPSLLDNFDPTHSWYSAFTTTGFYTIAIGGAQILDAAGNRVGGSRGIGPYGYTLTINGNSTPPQITVPEPSTPLLLLVGLVLLFTVTRHQTLSISSKRFK